MSLYTWRSNCLSQFHPLWVLLRDIFQLDLGSILSGVALPPRRPGWQPRAGSSDSFLRICQYQNWQIPVSAQPGPWGKVVVEEGQLPVSPQLLLGKTPLPPLPLVGLSLPGRVGAMPAPREPSPRLPSGGSPEAESYPKYPARGQSREGSSAPVPVASPAPAHSCLSSRLTLLHPGLTGPQCLSH